MFDPILIQTKPDGGGGEGGCNTMCDGQVNARQDETNAYEFLITLFFISLDVSIKLLYVRTFPRYSLF